MKDIIIQAKEVTKIYSMGLQEVRAVDGVSLEIKNGEFISIMGQSGSGKTTLLDILGCLDNTTSGSLEVLGKDVSNLKEKDLVKVRRQNIGFVFQDFLLIPSLNVLENVKLAFYLAHKRCNNDKAVKVLEKLGLSKRMHHIPKELSGGEKQRVAIARALVIEPKILFADEPTGNLDTKHSNEIFDLLCELHKSQNITIVLTTHNPVLGMRAQKMIYIKDGKLVDSNEASLCIRGGK